MEYLYLFIAWSGYFLIHSILASMILKEYCAKKFPSFFPYYRLSYSSIAIISLLPIFFIYTTTNQELVFEANLSIYFVGTALAQSGTIIGLKALKNYTASDFLGLGQITNKVELVGKLNTSGLNSIVRHPLYFSAILLIWGIWLIAPSYSLLVTNVSICGYLIVGTKLEEQKLIKQFGTDYLKYKATVPMLIPFNFFKKTTQR